MLTWHQANSYPFLAKAMLNKLLKNLLKSNPGPNPLLGKRWQALYCTRWNAGWPTTARVYLTKHKNRKVADGQKALGQLTGTPSHAWPRVHPKP
jgi:hypothetical protein